MNGALLSDAQNLQIYAQKGRGYYDPGPSGTLTFAVILLTIGAGSLQRSDENTPLYSDYLDCIQKLSDSDYDDAIQLADAIVHSQCDLQSLEQHEFIKNIKEKANKLTVAPFLFDLSKHQMVENTESIQNDSEEEHVENTESIHGDSNASDSCSETSEPADENPALLNQTLTRALNHERALTASFQFKAMIGLAAAGAVMLCLAIFVAFPPTLAAVLGLAGGVSLIASAGIFAYRQCTTEHGLDADNLNDSTLNYQSD